MDLQAVREFLAGKKTYGVAVIGALYLLGCWAGWWEYDEKVLAALGIGAIATLRSAIRRISGGTFLMVLLPVCMLTAGCAVVQSTQIDESPQRKITTTIKGRAFLANSAVLQKLAASTTDKSQTFGLTGASTAQTNTTVVADLVRLVELLRK